MAFASARMINHSVFTTAAAALSSKVAALSTKAGCTASKLKTSTAASGSSYVSLDPLFQLFLEVGGLKAPQRLCAREDLEFVPSKAWYAMRHLGFVTFGVKSSGCPGSGSRCGAFWPRKN